MLNATEIRQAVDNAIILSFIYHNKRRFFIPTTIKINANGDITHMTGVEKNSDNEAVKTFLLEKVTELVSTGITSPNTTQLLEKFEKVEMEADELSLMSEETALNRMMVMLAEGYTILKYSGTLIVRKDATFYIADIRGKYKEKA